MLNIRNITKVIALVLCLTALARAGEKEEGKIEPKLIYEKRFDFEIEQGKIGDDGSLFPTIFVTKDNRILFFDKNGRTYKTLTLNKYQHPILSEDSKYLGILNYPEDWWEKHVDISIELYDSMGQLLWRIKPKGKLYYDISIVDNPLGIAISAWDEFEFIGVDFYDRKGAILKSYKAPAPFPADTSLTSDKTLKKAGQKVVKEPRWSLLPLQNYYYLGKTLVTTNKHFYSMAKDAQCSWIAIFESNGNIVKIIEIPGESITEFVLSSDLKTLVYTSYPSAYQRVMGNKRKMMTGMYDVGNFSKKEINIVIQPQKASAFATLKITGDGRKFLVINGANLSLGDVERCQKIYDWKTSDSTMIKNAFPSLDGNYILCELEDQRLYLLNYKGIVVFEGKSSRNIIDAHFDEYSRFFDVLTEINFSRYKL